MEDKEGVWRTVGGRKIFIEEGQSLSEAMQKSGKFGKSKSKDFRELSDSKKKSYRKAIKTLDQLISKGWRQWIEKHERPMDYFGNNIAPVMRELKKSDPEEFEKINKLDQEFWKEYNYSDWKDPKFEKRLIEKAEKLREGWINLMGEDPSSKENRDTRYGDRKIINKEDYDTTVSALNTLSKQRNESDDVQEKARLERVIKNYSKNLQEYLKENPTPDYHAGRLTELKSKEDGTFDLNTQETKSYSDGYQVTFSTIGMQHSDEDYLQLVNKFKMHDHGTVDAGKFEGSAEISFNVTDLKTAAKLAYKYNQISIWDWKNSREIKTKGSGRWKGDKRNG